MSIEMMKFGSHRTSRGEGTVDEMFSLSDLDQHHQVHHNPPLNLNQSQQSFSSTIVSHISNHRAPPRILAPDMLPGLPSAILPPTTSQPASSSSSFQEQLHKTLQHFPSTSTSAHPQHQQQPRSASTSLYMNMPLTENKENQAAAAWQQFSNAATPVLRPLQQHHVMQSNFSVDSLPNQPHTSTLHNTTAVSNTNTTNTPYLQDRLHRDQQQQHQHKLYEAVLKQELEQVKISALEQSLFNEEKLRQELQDQKKHYEELFAQQEVSVQKQLAEKEQHVQSLQQQLITKQQEHREALQQKDQEYIQMMQQQEDKFKTQYQQLIQQHQEQLQKIQLQLQKDDENRKLTEKAKVEAKERSVVEAYEKKLKKYTKKVDQVVKEYHVKELKLQGALEEARRELIHLGASYDAKDSLAREELILKDKKLIHIQQRLDSVDEIDQMARTWRESAKDLASMVIRTCATAEDLPQELWSSTTPGLFTSVWDDLQKLRPNQPSQLPGGGGTYQEDIIQSYAKKRKECIMANRNLLAKCLKYSKMVHERVKAEILPVGMTSNAL